MRAPMRHRVSVVDRRNPTKEASCLCRSIYVFNEASRGSGPAVGGAYGADRSACRAGGGSWRVVVLRENPPGRLLRVARNSLRGELRQRRARRRILEQNAEEDIGGAENGKEIRLGR